MSSLLDLLQQKFLTALQKSYPLFAEEGDPKAVEVTQSRQEKFGDYQCNAAMKVTKLLKENPRTIAATIIEQLDLASEMGGIMIERVEIAGPGFINIFLTKEDLQQRINRSLWDPRLGIGRATKQQRVVIDFSSPNVAKEMHVGHLRCTIIGDCLARLYRFLGYDVLGLNHVGDWGTAFGMLIAYLKEECPGVLSGEQIPDAPALMRWYQEAKVRFDEDPAFKLESQQQVVALQGGEEDAVHAWKLICAISRQSFQEVYDLLGVNIEERGESFYNPMLCEVVEDLERKGMIKDSDGAKCVFLDGFTNRDGEPLPFMVKKRDGGYNYATTDLAAMRHRVQDEKADHIMILTDAGQAQHFQMLFKTAEQVGYVDPAKVKVEHVPFGLVLRADGKKFRTREGGVERLVDLLYRAVDKAREILKERGGIDESVDIDQLAHALGIAAVKYADLSTNRTGDYHFSYDKMLRFEGNTAAFLMYSYVRVAGIKRKVGQEAADLEGKQSIQLTHPSERALALHLLQFEEALNVMARELLPNRLTDYLFGLAERFNAFFRDCRVEGAEEQESRLLLCERTARTLARGFDILGINPVERM